MSWTVLLTLPILRSKGCRGCIGIMTWTLAVHCFWEFELEMCVNLTNYFLELGFPETVFVIVAATAGIIPIHAF